MISTVGIQGRPTALVRHQTTSKVETRPAPSDLSECVYLRIPHYVQIKVRLEVETSGSNI